MDVLNQIGLKIAKLINVKSIITILLTIVVAYKAIRGEMDIQEIYLMIIAFYFGTQIEKKNIESEENKND